MRARQPGRFAAVALRRPPSPRVLLLALAVSAALHVGLALLLAQRPPEPAFPRTPPVEVEVVEGGGGGQGAPGLAVPGTAPGATRPPPPVPDTGPRPPPRKRRPQQEGPAVREGPAVPGTGTTPVPGTEVPGTGTAEAGGGAREGAGLPGDAPRRGAGDLSPSALPQPVSPPPPEPTPAQRVRESLESYASQSRVQGGGAHTYFYALRDVLRAAWRAKETLQRRKPPGRECAAEVRLRQAPSGRLLEARILQPSCDPAQDEELLNDLRVAADALPEPPPEVVKGRDEVTSTFRFAFKPVPALQLGTQMSFDIVNMVDKKALPPPNPRTVSLVSDR